MAISLLLWTSGSWIPCEVIADLPRCRPCNSSSACAVDDGVDVVRIAALCPSRALPLDEVIADWGIPLPGLFPLHIGVKAQRWIEGVDHARCRACGRRARLTDTPNKGTMPYTQVKQDRYGLLLVFEKTTIFCNSLFCTISTNWQLMCL